MNSIDNLYLEHLKNLISQTNTTVTKTVEASVTLVARQLRTVLAKAVLAEELQTLRQLRAENGPAIDAAMNSTYEMPNCIKSWQNDYRT